MKAKFFLLLFVPLFALFVMTRLSAEDLPVLSPEGSEEPAGETVRPEGEGTPAPKKDTSKSGTGASIMTAEQGEELGRKLDKILEDQKKLTEKIEQLQKDVDFIKVSVRVR